MEKKFADYGKKLNASIEKFFKTAATKLDYIAEKDAKLSFLTETVDQQREIFKQTHLLKEEELTLAKDEINGHIKTLTALVGKLDNRLNENTIDITESR